MASRKSKRALVLGCGGVAGGAWSIAALGAVRDTLHWDPREADIIIGTSVGAVLATMLGAGVSVDRLLACQRGDADAGCTWNHDTDTGGDLPPLPARRFTGAKLAWHGLRGRVSALTAFTGMLPAGTFDMQPFRNLVDSVVPAGQWVKHPNTWLVTVDVVSGERVAFGAPGAPPAAMRDAMCASYGVPGWCPPVEIGGRNYIDGGVASPVSADLLIDSDVEEIVVLAPMASTQVDRPSSMLEKVERAARRMMTGIVDREVAQLEAAGKRVIRIEPGPLDLKAFGFNMMDPKRRLRVFETALKTTPDVVARAIQRRAVGRL